MRKNLQSMTDNTVLGSELIRFVENPYYRL